MNDQCLSPLVCMDDVCAWPPPPTTSADESDDGSSGETSTTDDGGSDSGPATCTEDADCPSVLELCRQADGVCIDVRDAVYEIRVPSWSPGTGCGGGTFEGDADLYWSLMLGGTEVAVSSWVRGGCPGSWPSTTRCVPPASFHEPFFLGTWDEDGADDTLQDSLWWDGDGNTLADPIDPFILVEGVYDGATGSGGQVQIEFIVVETCG